MTPRGKSPTRSSNLVVGATNLVNYTFGDFGELHVRHTFGTRSTLVNYTFGTRSATMKTELSIASICESNRVHLQTNVIYDSKLPLLVAKRDLRSHYRVGIFESCSFLSLSTITAS